ncbi:MAG: hypothetical protein H0U60_20010 [Blastocatellia bacterium]|nr:hypothetical protein [Blastocatellia bacterium]
MSDKTKPTIEELKAKYLDYYAALPIQKLAAGYIGRNEDTIIVWKKADKKFADSVLEKESEWARSNAARVKSREWLLERVMKNHFSPRTEITGPDGERIIPIYGGNSAIQGHDSDTKDLPAKETD